MIGDKNQNTSTNPPIKNKLNPEITPTIIVNNLTNPPKIREIKFPNKTLI